MRRILQPFRVVGVIFIILFFLVHMSVVRVLVRARWPRIRWANRILAIYSRITLRVLNVRVHLKGLENLKGLTNGLFVGNHLSYLDVLVISSVRPMCFVTSVEVRDSFGLGHICRMAGCLFVERRSRTKLLNEVGELAEGLQNGVNAAIFPEATSTNGEQIFRFRRPLYLSAMQARVPVIPFCLNYHTVNGQPINRMTRDWVFYYGDMDFLPHIWAMSQAGGIDVDLVLMKPHSVSDFKDPGDLAAVTQSDVESVFRPVR